MCNRSGFFGFSKTVKPANGGVLVSFGSIIITKSSDLLIQDEIPITLLQQASSSTDGSLDVSIASRKPVVLRMESPEKAALLQRIIQDASASKKREEDASPNAQSDHASDDEFVS